MHSNVRGHQLYVQYITVTGSQPYVQYNKDHQRMMLDLVFMNVQSLRSFLTAVTTTAVAPIAVIFTCIYLNIHKIT